MTEVGVTALRTRHIHKDRQSLIITLLKIHKFCICETLILYFLKLIKQNLKFLEMHKLIYTICTHSIKSYVF